MPSADRPILSGQEPAISNSVWTLTGGPKPETVVLAATETCDVLIIGGGFNGITAGLYCAEQGAKVILVEANEVGYGASGRNAGQVNPGQFISPSEITKRLGAEYGPRFLKDLGGAPDLVRDLIKTHNIDCFADDRPIVRCATTSAKMRELEAQAIDWQALGADVRMVYGDALRQLNGSTRYKAALMDYRGFTIQPLAYLRGLAVAAVKKGLRITEGARVTALEATSNRWLATVGSSRITADKIILSTNAYSDSLVPGFKEEFMPLGAFSVATRDPIPDAWRKKILPGYIAMWDTHKIPLWFRYDPENRLQVGSIGFLPWQARNDQWVRRAIKFVFPEAPRFDWGYRWSGIVGHTTSQLPYLVEPRTGIYATIGCNGRGIAPNAYFGKLLARMALGEPVEPALPLRKPTPFPARKLAMEAHDIGTRLYRNTLLFR